jgi:hypothetical protein
VRVEFNEDRLVSDAGLLIAAALADRLGLEEMVNELVWLGYRLPGAPLPGRKVMTLVHGMLAGGHHEGKAGGRQRRPVLPARDDQATEREASGHLRRPPLSTYIGDPGPRKTAYIGTRQSGGAWWAIDATGHIVKKH